MTFREGEMTRLKKNEVLHFYATKQKQKMKFCETYVIINKTKSSKNKTPPNKVLFYSFTG
jgi:hypothetical protein